MRATSTAVRRMAIAVTLVTTLAAGALAVTGCGESTQTVSVGSAPNAGQAATTTSKTAGTNPTSTPSTTTNTATSTTSTPSTTRTAPAPAFAEAERAKAKSTGGKGVEGLEGAQQVLREHGYEAKETAEYHPNQTLRVLIGTGAKSNDGYDKRAFFFIDEKYIGTDASTPSAQVSVVGQSDTEVTLAYALYHPNDALCCPSGGEAKVTYQLNNGKLEPTSPIPPAQSSTGLSRQ